MEIAPFHHRPPKLEVSRFSQHCYAAQKVSASTSSHGLIERYINISPNITSERRILKINTMSMSLESDNILFNFGRSVGQNPKCAFVSSCELQIGHGIEPFVFEYNLG